MILHSSRNNAIMLLVVLCASSISMTHAFSATTVGGAATTGTSDPPPTYTRTDVIAAGNYPTATEAKTKASAGVSRLASTATGEGSVVPGALSTEAIAIFSSMQAAFVSLRVQLAETEAALAQQMPQLIENQAFDTDLVHTKLANILAGLDIVRVEQAENKAELHTQMLELSANQDLDAGSLYAELVDMRETFEMKTAITRASSASSASS